MLFTKNISFKDYSTLLLFTKHLHTYDYNFIFSANERFSYSEGIFIDQIRKTDYTIQKYYIRERLQRAKQKIITFHNLKEIIPSDNFLDYDEKFYIEKNKTNQFPLNYEIESENNFINRLTTSKVFGKYYCRILIIREENNLDEKQLIHDLHEEFIVLRNILKSTEINIEIVFPPKIVLPEYTSFGDAIEMEYDAIESWSNDKYNEWEDLGTQEENNMDDETDGFWRIQNDLD